MYRLLRCSWNASVPASLICPGVRGLFDGLTGTLLRQMTYSMTRFAAYDWAKGVVHTGE